MRKKIHKNNKIIKIFFFISQLFTMACIDEARGEERKIYKLRNTNFNDILFTLHVSIIIFLLKLRQQERK